MIGAGLDAPVSGDNNRLVPEPTENAEKIRNLTVTILLVQGKVQMREGDDQPWKPVKAGMTLDANVEIRTGLRSLCHFVIPPNQYVTLDRITKLKVIEAIWRKDTGKYKTDLGMEYGRVRYKIEAAGLEHDAKIHTPGNTLAIRGTDTFVTNTPPFNHAVASYMGRVQTTTADGKTITFGDDPKQRGGGSEQKTDSSVRPHSEGHRFGWSNAQHGAAQPVYASYLTDARAPTDEDAPGKEEFLFSVGLEFVEALDVGEIPDGLLRKFDDGGYGLPVDVGAAVEQEGRRWRIVDPQRGLTFIIKKADDKLDVYLRKRRQALQILKDILDDAAATLGLPRDRTPLVVLNNLGGPAVTSLLRTDNVSTLLAQTPTEMGLGNESQGGGVPGADIDTDQIRDDTANDTIEDEISDLVDVDMLVFNFTWQGAVDLDGFVTDPGGQTVCVFEDTQPHCVFSTPEGGVAGPDDQGPDGSEDIDFKGNELLSGPYEVGMKYFSGQEIASFNVTVTFSPVGGESTIIDTFSGELDTIDAEVTKVVNVDTSGP